MSASRWLTSLALISAAGGAGAAPTPHNVNASEIGAGTPRGINWSQEAVESPMWCGGACSYMQVSTAKIAPDSLLKYGPTAWPGNYVTTMPNVAAVERETLTPAGTTDSSGREIVHDSPHYERGAVDVNRAGEFLNTRVYQSGNQSSGGTGFGAAAAAYHVKVTNQSSGNRDYFVQFVAPSRTGGVSVPYYQGGPSGNQYFNVSQNKYAKSRSAVDVLVNGLPVWSTSRSYIIPEET
ncbi:MAG TPA: hypothetical protein VK629_03005, partial [Steroidobacteraceae bacterium]|nr:hypothetical protein [Steroidobacteraceae bacterium]